MTRHDDFTVQEEVFRERYGIRLLGYTNSPDYREVVQFFRDLRQALPDELDAPREEVRTPRLDRVTLSNIGPFDDLTLEFHKEKIDNGAPSLGAWNVLLGNNGCGKSSLLKAIALGLCGDDKAARESAGRLLKSGSASGSILLQFGTETYATALTRATDGGVLVSTSPTPLQSGRWVVLGFPALRGAWDESTRSTSTKRKDVPVVDDVLPLLEGVVDRRTEGLKRWIADTHIDSQRSDLAPAVRERKARLRDAFFEVFSEFVPGINVRFSRVEEVNERKQVWVLTDDGEVSLDQISQGTASLLGWVGTLLQRMYEIYHDVENPEQQPALVLIDELDAHMHPEWQQLLVTALRKKFPAVQVIATTHSPLVVLNTRPGEIFKLGREGRKAAIEIAEQAPASEGTPEPLPIRVDVIRESLQELTAAQALTLLYGLSSARSKETTDIYRRYTALAANSDRTEAENDELESLAGKLDVRLASPDETAEARKARQWIEEMHEEELKRMPDAERERLLAELMVQLQEIATDSRRPG